MPQLKKSYTEVTIPLSKMSFTPDVPSSALGPNEYNYGENVETDVRGIRSSNGDEFILPAVTGTPFYITGGYRPAATPTGENTFWFIVATIEGKWWASNGTPWQDVTPPTPPFDDTQYAPETNITEAWNGTVVILNDGINPPFFLPDEQGASMVSYTNNIPPKKIQTVAPDGSGVQKITIQTTGGETPYTTAPFVPGDKIIITDINNFYNGEFTVAEDPLNPGVGSTTTEIWYSATPGGAYPGGAIGKVSAAYTWNYDPNWKNLTAKFLRIYSTPNVGNILVAGNLTAIDQDDNVLNYPVSVAWSQAFGLNQAPLTWQPTVLNVANQLEVPLRGEVVDAFPSNGQLFLCSYWDTVVFTPMNYATTQTPILGVRLFNQGRGLLNANCWANTDEMVYGIDARDVWVFDGRTFKGLGNQRVKHWLFDQLDRNNWDMVYIETNTEKNQVEIYYPDANATAYNGKKIPNKMLSYRYDLDCWNAPRDITVATFACESPVWTQTYNYDGLMPSNISGSGTGLEITLTKTGTTYTVKSIDKPGSGYALTNQVKVLGSALGGTTPGNDCTLTVTEINSGGKVAALTVSGTGLLEWSSNPASRSIVYAQGIEDSQLVQKDTGYYFRKINGDPRDIVATWRRDNIKLVKDYSTKTLVHRILPEIVNLNSNNVEIDPAVNPELVGNVSITVEGANSVGQTPQQVTGETISTDTDYPWVQISQNAHRVNALEMTTPVDENATPGTIWMCNAVTWQFTEVEDDR